MKSAFIYKQGLTKTALHFNPPIGRHWLCTPIALFCLIILMENAARAQNMSINNSGASPDSSAMLDVSSLEQGFLMPRMTSAQRLAISNPADGLMVLQTNGSAGLYMYDVAGAGSWNHLLDSTQISALLISLGAPALDSVLAAGNDAMGRTIVNLDTLGIGISTPTNPLSVYNASGTTNAATAAIRFGDNGGSAYLGSGATYTGLWSGSGNLQMAALQSNDHVGIGTDSPEAKLHIAEDGTNQFLVSPLSLTGEDGVVSIRGARNSTNAVHQARLNFQNYDNDLTSTNYLGSITGRVTNAGTNVGDLVFSSYSDGATAAEAMRITSAGRIGINESSPSSKLHISATDNSGDIRLDDTHPFIFQNTTSSGNTGTQYLDNGTMDFEFYYSSIGGNFTMNHDGSAGNELTLNSSGNFGINQTSPTVKFQIDGGTDASLSGGSGYLLINSENTTNLVLDENEIMARNNGSESPLYLNSDGGDVYFHFGQGGGTQVIIEDGGDVGIGTSSPSAKLDVNGDIEGTSIRLTSGAANNKVLVSDGSGNGSWDDVPSKTHTLSFPAHTFSDDVLQGGTSFGTYGWNYRYVRFDDGQTDDMVFSFIAPSNLSSNSVTVRVYYTSEVAGGDFRVFFATKTLSNDEGSLGDNPGGSYNTWDGPTAAHDMKEFTRTFGTGGDDYIFMIFRRVGSDGLDTSTGELRILGIAIDYES